MPSETQPKQYNIKCSNSVVDIEGIRNQIESFHTDAIDQSTDQEKLSSVYNNGLLLKNQINQCLQPKITQINGFMTKYGNDLIDADHQKISATKLFEDGKSLYTNMMYVIASMIIAMIFLVVYILYFSSKGATKAASGFNIPRIPFFD